MRTLAIDLGSRRVGLALSDEGGRYATPYETLTVSSPDNAIDQILPIIEREGVERLLIGLPLNMDDTLGPAAKAAVAWGKQLSARSALAAHFVDERLSSFEAEQVLNARKRSGEKLTHKRKKEQLDALAATGFLRDFLEGRLSAVDVG